LYILILVSKAERELMAAEKYNGPFETELAMFLFR